MADINTNDMLLFGGLCCCNTVLYLDFPALVGCSGVSECLCIREEFCLRPGGAPMPCVIGPADGFLFKIGIPCWSIGLKIPTLLLKSKAQCCCFVGNVAFPPDKDTPLLFALYGLVLFPVLGCCLPMRNVAR